MKSTYQGSMRFGTFLVTVIFLGTGISHAQSGAGQHSAPWGDAARNQGAGQAGNQASTPPKAESAPPKAESTSPKSESPPPAQTASVEPNVTPEGDAGSCAYSTPQDETFLCKLIRIFYGPDTPRGPNRDVEENISAGGAGG